MHDFIYGALLSMYYYFLFYLFTEGPVSIGLLEMGFVGQISLVAAIGSIIISIVGGLFKFNIGMLVSAKTSMSFSNLCFNSFFFTKMLYVICTIILGFYLIFAFIIRYSIEFIELPDKEDAFKEGRREMSNKTMVFNHLVLNVSLISVNVLHIFQMLYWLKLMSNS